ncbi:kinase-like domain-containing protein [Rhizophagus irregularis DAOM 181602=DAOM 197198]|uniref:Kinase-like domain-containing protein n=1 Tax=Rhizophagus irregularis (strain DAOM 181602 / DAOM 197198 / MUCL 43194) TaxID=747089 RepID=A0A2P4QNV7_RHIID|nr:kinase-like domain-containing protein [Rhizophagus irregularis DAOM 181602=DAOM 197198]POG79315.1 kinase-like domain-containing protein [Rhizophagus irregularis DAOM 181602=DAOM 197198]|eukprot:XP_025186181.1 kinase-like domain-containing protein [Rhizophagus irregularis DAOM 181602=DAOM 197198]
MSKNKFCKDFLFSFSIKLLRMEDRGQSKREFKHPRSPRPQKKAKSDEKSTGKEAIEAAVSFSKFIPLISEIGNVFNEILDLVEAAEHNKRTCGILRDRVNVAELAVRELRVRNKDKKDFFNSKNYKSLQNLVIIIARIKKFISDISQMKPLIKHIKAKNIEKTFVELCEEFDGYVKVLCFSIHLTTADELEQLRADQNDLADYLKEMVDGMNEMKSDANSMMLDVNDMRDDMNEIRDDMGSNAKEIKELLKNLSDQFSSTVVKVNTMNTTMEKFMNENLQNQTKIDNIFRTHSLNFCNYEADNNEKPRKNGRVTKWYNIINKSEEFAFKTISEKEDQRIVQNHVTILKELHDWQNIIKFYGLTCEGNKWYLVTEWAEFGNLREFYTNHKDRFNLELKLRISFNIARGLNFLRAVEIVHRDIRAENILITIDETAKLANFKLSRYLTSATLNQSQTLKRVRYCAPELLERAPNYKYDQKCEVYSFGILLWEIAEERIPYEGNEDIVDIIDRVRNKRYREPFSGNSQMPKKFKQLEIDAVRHDPDFRPKITDMFDILKNCYKDHIKGHPQDSSSSSISNPSRNNSMQELPPERIDEIDLLESFKYMTLTDASKQHKIINKEGYVDCPNKDKIVAELFKEVADDEANEFPEAKVRYGDCLYNGKGVKQNHSEALKYFEKAAEDGIKIAMYNAGNMYYNGNGCTRDIEKAKYYMNLSAYNGHELAIEFLDKFN